MVIRVGKSNYGSAFKLTVDMVDIVLSRFRNQTTMVPFDEWKTGDDWYEALETGRIDMVRSLWGITPLRRHRIKFSHPLFQAQPMLTMHLKDTDHDGYQVNMTEGRNDNIYSTDSD